MMELTYFLAVTGTMVDRLTKRFDTAHTDDRNTHGRLRGDGGYTLEAVLVIGLLAAIALGALIVISAKIMARAKGIDGGDTPTPITVPT